MDAAYHVEENFLSDFDVFREVCDNLDYTGMTNPVDDVFYPHVTDAIPDSIKVEVKNRLELLLGFNLSINAMFLRESPEGVECPHLIHTDTTMGAIGCILYMNKPEDCLGGTSLVIHNKTGIYKEPENEKQLKVWQDDHANIDAWNMYDICLMASNRAFIFDTTLMHMATPAGGFGEPNKGSRLVLITFMDAE